MGKIGRPRKKSNDTNGAIDLTDVDLGAAVFQDGLPTNSDGSAVPEGEEISREKAKKLGAVTAESAKFNKELAKKLRLKAAGEPVRWDEKNALDLFENVKSLFPASAVFIRVQRIEPHPPIDYPPFAMITIKNSKEFFEYVVRNYHKNGPYSRYMVTFKNGPQKCAEGYLDIEDMTATQESEMNNRQPPMPMGFPPGPYAQAYPQPYGYPAPPGYPQYPGYPPQGPPPQGFGAPPAQAAPPVAPAPAPAAAQAAPAPQPEPSPHLPWSVPPQAQPQPQQTPVAQDPMVLGALNAMYQETKNMQASLLQTNDRMAQTLGELAEMRRQQMMQQQQQHMQQMFQPPSPPPLSQPVQQQPVQQQPVGVSNGFPPGMPAPPGYQPAMPQQMHQPIPQQQFQPPYPQYGQQQMGPWPPGYMPMPGYPGYWVPIQPQQQPVQQQQSSPTQSFNESVNMITGVAKQVRMLQNMFTPTSGGEEEEDEGIGLGGFAPPPVAEPPPFTTIPVSAGPNPVVMSINKDGSVNKEATFVGNLPKIANFMGEVGKTITEMQKNNQQQQQQQRHVQHVQVQQMPIQRQALPQQQQQPVQQQQQQEQPIVQAPVRSMI